MFVLYKNVLDVSDKVPVPNILESFCTAALSNKDGLPVLFGFLDSLEVGFALIGHSHSGRLKYEHSVR
jgi:hypothetical protein